MPVPVPVPVPVLVPVLVPVPVLFVPVPVPVPVPTPLPLPLPEFARGPLVFIFGLVLAFGLLTLFKSEGLKSPLVCVIVILHPFMNIGL